MNKGDLKTGMVVETRSGIRYLVLTGDLPTINYDNQSIILVNDDGFEPLNKYNDDLTAPYSDDAYDIMKVFQPYIQGVDFMLSTKTPPIWQREAEVDWTKVAVDTKVLVRDAIGEQWIPRHFCKYSDDKVYTWNNGETSFTSESYLSSTWNFTKLA